jgi:F0F1-type ATP synthase membrane subunit b/b'
MNLDEIRQQLTQIQNSGDATFANAAQYISQIIDQAQSGQMTPAEFTEIIQDIQRQLQIIQEISQLQLKEQLNTIINGLISIASAMA